MTSPNKALTRVKAFERDRMAKALFGFAPRAAGRHYHAQFPSEQTGALGLHGTS